jgi:coenzyme F420 hydrogenase subunit beta
VSSVVRYAVSPLFETVVKGDYCIGCGACASLPGSPITMELDARGLYAPKVTDDHLDAPDGFDVASVCPFAAPVDEDDLAEAAYGDAPHHHAHVGRYQALFAGYVVEEPYRERGSSGGLTSWVLTRLLEEGHVDGVIHVVEGAGDPLFRFSASMNVPEVLRGAKSRYYPVELSQVIDHVRANPGRYALVGVPCFVKAARLLARHDPQVGAALTHYLAIFCGHLKTTAFAESLAWQMGIQPGSLTSIDFRVKLAGRPAYAYGVRVTGRERQEVELPMAELFGGDWGHGLFKPRACDFCDDIAGEAADAAFGDAWLPEYQADGRGTNIVVVRHPVLRSLLARGVRDGSLHLDAIGVEQVFLSQAGNFRHRREGLSVRLAALERVNAWHPPKRVRAASAASVSPRRRRLYELRSTLSAVSHEAFLEAKRIGDFEHFRSRMAPLMRQYDRIREPMWRRVARRLRRLLWRRGKR